jgi:hypothetical protein
MADPIGFVVGILESVVHWLQGIAPGGFGLILIPLAVLGVISLLAARNR